jgi:hypothetical protein
MVALAEPVVAEAAVAEDQALANHQALVAQVVAQKLEFGYSDEIFSNQRTRVC